MDPGRDNACPDAETVGRYCDGLSHGAERDAIEMHLASCEACCVVVESACDTAAASSSPSIRIRPRTVWYALAAAAAVLLVAGLSARFVGEDPQAPSAPSDEVSILEAAFTSGGGSGVVELAPHESLTGERELIIDPFPSADGDVSDDASNAGPDTEPRKA